LGEREKGKTRKGSKARAYADDKGEPENIRCEEKCGYENTVSRPVRPVGVTSLLHVTEMEANVFEKIRCVP